MAAQRDAQRHQDVLRQNTLQREANAHLREANAQTMAERDALEQLLERKGNECALLELEKAALIEKCKRLEDECARLHFLEAENEKMRENIALLKSESETKCATMQQEHQATVRNLNEQAAVQNELSEQRCTNIARESQATNQALREQIRLLREQSELQRLMLERARNNGQDSLLQ